MKTYQSVRSPVTLVCLTGAVLCFGLHSAAAQNTVFTAPMVGIGDSFSETVGVGIGNASPSAHGGFSILGGGGRLNFTWTAEQSSSRSISSAAPMVVVPNGGWGTFQHVIQRPFVVGFNPVVGGWSSSIAVPQPLSMPPAPPISPLNERIRRYASGETISQSTVTRRPQHHRDADAAVHGLPPASGSSAERNAAAGNNRSVLCERGFARHKTANNRSFSPQGIPPLDAGRTPDTRPRLTHGIEIFTTSN